MSEQQDIVLRVIIPPTVESSLMLKILSENSNMSRAEAHAEALRRQLGAWITVEVEVGQMIDPEDVKAVARLVEHASYDVDLAAVAVTEAKNRGVEYAMLLADAYWEEVASQ